MPDLLHLLDRPLGLPKGAFKGVQREMLDRIALLAESIYEQKRAAIIVFEGWDAAGKGTTIRTLTERLDARGYKVLATQAPRTHEKQKPWLWRFWMNLPRYGQIAIFDRSWYGRVLVERVHGLTPVPEWIAAYEEINQFERTLADDGTIILKFWLHIARREQLRRFIELSQQPGTAWQITAEDWENHCRYDEYVAAVRDMLANTSTAYAPWAAIDATNREYRMYCVCRGLIERLETALGVASSHWPSPEALAAFDATQAVEADKNGKPGKRKRKEQDTTLSGPAEPPRAGEGEPKPKRKDKDKDKDKDKKKARKKGKQKAEQPATPPLAGAVGQEVEPGALPQNGKPAPDASEEVAYA